MNKPSESRLLTNAEALKALNKYPTNSTQPIEMRDFELQSFMRLLVAQSF